MTIEHKRYLTLEEYSRGLRETTLSKREIQETIDHERAHFEKALELGYAPVYSLERYYPQNSNLATLIITAIIFPRKIPTPEHMIQILLVPKVPSDEDLYVALKLKRDIEKFRKGIK